MRMKKIIFVTSLLVLIIFLSGCVELLFPPEFTKFCEQEYQTYKQNDYLEYLTFNVPDDISRNGLLIELDIIEPEGGTQGTHQQQFYYPVPNQCIFEFGYRIKLLHLGMWHINFRYYQGDTTEHLVAEGQFNIIVEEDTDTIYFYELSDFNVPKYALYGSTVEVSFTVENTGSLNSRVPLCFWDSSIIKNESKYEYGKEFFRAKNEGKFLESGQGYTYKHILQNIDRNYVFNVNYGSNHESKELKVVSSIPKQEIVDDSPPSYRGIENSTWFMIILVVGAIVAFFWIKTM